MFEKFEQSLLFIEQSLLFIDKFASNKYTIKTVK